MSSNRSGSKSKSETSSNKQSKVNTTKQLPSDGSENEGERSSVIEAEKKRKKQKGNNAPLNFIGNANNIG